MAAGAAPQAHRLLIAAGAEHADGGGRRSGLSNHALGVSSLCGGLLRSLRRAGSRRALVPEGSLHILWQGGRTESMTQRQFMDVSMRHQ